MVSDQQVKRLWRLAGKKLPFEVAAAKAGMDPKTARKYLRNRRLPSEMGQKNTWQTLQDSFTGVWEEVRERLALEPGLQAKTLFEYLQTLYPGRFPDGQVRTLQRRIKYWRATKDRHERCSLPKSIVRACYANQTLRIAGNSE